MKKPILMVLLAIVLLCTTFEAWAWGGYAHTTTTVIAERHLTPKAKEMVEHYLGHTLPFYAIWLDQVAYSDPYHKEAPGHTNTAIDYTGTLPDNEKKSVSLAIERIRKDMKDLSKLNDSTIRVNLLYLIHTVADLHCPGHNYIPGKPGSPKRHYRMTKGKNNARVSFHSFWDNDAFTYGRIRWNAERIADHIDKLTPKEAKKIVKGTAFKWYYGEMIDAKQEACDLTPTSGHINDIPREVRLRMQQICDEKVVAGGYRLAHIMNEIFK